MNHTKQPQGHIVTHASNVLHGGHPITRGKRYILVGAFSLAGYNNALCLARRHDSDDGSTDSGFVAADFQRRI